jgi:hypothetical protein
VGFFLGEDMFSIFSIAYAAAIAATPASGLVVHGCELGEHYVFDAVACELTVENPTGTPIKLTKITADVTGDSVEQVVAEVLPRSRIYVPAHVAFESYTGLQRHGFRIHTDEPGRPEIHVPVRGFALSVLDEQPKADFGIVDLNAASQKRSITLKSQEFPTIAIEKVLSKPDWVDVQATGNSLSITVRPDAQLGLRDDFIKLQLNAPQQREAWILASADIRGDVVPSTNPLAMGLIRTSDDNEFRIALNSRSDKKFNVGAVELENVQGTVKVGACVPDRPSCHWLTLKLTKNQPGSIKGNLFVTLPDTKQKLKISVRGLLVDKNFETKPLDPKAQEQSSHASSTAKELDLATAIKGVVNDSPQQSPPGDGPLLNWSVANGQLIHGFQIFRSNSEQGPFTLLNASTIPNKAVDGSTEAYQFRDNTAASGKTYWYYIGIVYIDGHKQQLTSPQKVVAK